MSCVSARPPSIARSACAWRAGAPDHGRRGRGGLGNPAHGGAGGRDRAPAGAAPRRCGAGAGQVEPRPGRAAPRRGLRSPAGRAPAVRRNPTRARGRRGVAGGARVVARRQRDQPLGRQHQPRAEIAPPDQRRRDCPPARGSRAPRLRSFAGARGPAPPRRARPPLRSPEQRAARSVASSMASFAPVAPGGRSTTG